MRKLIKLAPLLLVATPLVTLSCAKSKVENEDVIILRETFLDRREMGSTPENTIHPISTRKIVKSDSNATELIIIYDVVKTTALAMLNYFLPNEQRLNSKNVINKNARNSEYKTETVKIALAKLYENEIIDVIQKSLIENDKIHNKVDPKMKSVELVFEAKEQLDDPDTPNVNESLDSSEIFISLVFKINVVNNNESGLVLNGAQLDSTHKFNIDNIKAELEKYPTENNDATASNDIKWARQLNIEIINAIKSFPTR